MFAFNRRTRVYLYREPVDLRASFDGLFARTRELLKQDPYSGHVFVFFNRSRTSVKALYWDGTGLVIMAKRLEKGRFSSINPHWPEALILTAAEFSLYFEGADLSRRFIDSPEKIKKTSIPKASELVT